MEKNPDITNPIINNEHTMPVPWHFLTSGSTVKVSLLPPFGIFMDTMIIINFWLIFFVNAFGHLSKINELSGLEITAGQRTVSGQK